MKFYNHLKTWYLQHERDLPWRKSNDPYVIWLSEIILQQTRVAQGLAYFYKFIEHFPTVFHLAEADEETVLKLWQGLGYYSRARNLHFSAKWIVSEKNGVFPENYKSLLQLKGVGDYTASAIASISYNEPVAVVDGNVYRVLARYFGIATPINSSEGIKEFKLLAEKVLSKKNPGEHNQAMMDFGSMQCKPALPLCDSCPFAGSCVAFLSNRVSDFPVKTNKTKVRNRYFNYIVLQTPDEQTVLQKRTGKGIWQNLYEFPVVETDASVNVYELIANPKFQKIVSIPNSNIKKHNLKEWVHKLSHQHLFVTFWIVEGDFQHKNKIANATVSEYPVPRIIEKFLEEYSFQ
jgi:A/G-specific adenine glycosylase